jgi:hypothetical protein
VNVPEASDNPQWKQSTKLRANKRHRAGQRLSQGRRSRADRHSAVRTGNLHQTRWLITDLLDLMLTTKINEKTTRTIKMVTRRPTPGCKSKLTRRTSHWLAIFLGQCGGRTSDTARASTILCSQTRRARLKKRPRPQPLKTKPTATTMIPSTMQVRSGRRNPSNAKSEKVVVVTCTARKRRTPKTQPSIHQVSGRTIGGRSSAQSTSTL